MRVRMLVEGPAAAACVYQPVMVRSATWISTRRAPAAAVAASITTAATVAAAVVVVRLPSGAIVGEIRITLVLRAEVEGALGGRDYGSIGLEVLSIISSPSVELFNARPGPLDALGGSFF